MAENKAIEERIKQIKDENWQENSHELLKSISGEAREFVACSLNQDRHERLFKKTPQNLPERLRKESISQDKLDVAAYETLMAMSQRERHAVLEEIVPGNVWAVEAGLAAIQRDTCGESYEPKWFRRPRGPQVIERQALWLMDVLRDLGPWKAPLSEIAGMASHLDIYGGNFPWLLAGAIDSGTGKGDKVKDILIATIRGENPHSDIDTTVIQALLSSSKPEAWESVEKLLLAAQRQEGLRQNVLESLLPAHPTAFVRMCRLILEHGLARFSSVVRAADVWFGLLWDSASRGVIEPAIELAVKYLDEPGLREKAVTKGKPVEAYFAMWAAGFEDFDEMLPLAAKAMVHRDAEVRFAAVRLLALSEQDSAGSLLIQAIGDADMRVAAAAVGFFGPRYDDTKTPPPWKRDAFDALEKLLAGMGGKQIKLKAALWPWTGRMFKSSEVGAALIEQADPLSATRLIKHLKAQSPREREQIAGILGGKGPSSYSDDDWPGPEEVLPPIPEEARQALVELLSDGSASVVEEAARGLHNRPIEKDEIAALELMLKRANSQVRTLAQRRLLQLDDGRLLAAGKNLLAAGDAQRRLGGLEVLRNMVERKRSAAEASKCAQAWRGLCKKLTKSEETAFKSIVEATVDRPRREDAFGLLRKENLSKPSTPRALRQLSMSAATWNCICEIAEIVVANKERELPREEQLSYDPGPALLGDDELKHRIKFPEAGKTLEQERKRCPITDLVEGWLSKRGLASRDEDGLELLRARAALEIYRFEELMWIFRIVWPKKVRASLVARCNGAVEIKAPTISYFLDWAMKLSGKNEFGEVILDLAESALADGGLRILSSYEDDPEEPEAPAIDGVLTRAAADWIHLYEDFVRRGVISPSKECVRIWEIATMARKPATVAWNALNKKDKEDSYNDEAASLGISPSGEAVLAALRAGRVNEDDLLDLMTHSYWSGEDGKVNQFSCCPLLDDASESEEEVEEQVEAVSENEPGQQEPEQSDKKLDVLDAIDAAKRRLEREFASETTCISASNRLRDRLIGLELGRGDTPTEATPMARSLRYAGGADVCIRCLSALGKGGLLRNASWRDQSRQGTLTQFVSRTLPGVADTPQLFAASVANAGIDVEDLVTLGVFAPQWVRHVSATLGKGWESYEDAVWWIRGHTKARETHSETRLQKQHGAMISERTALGAYELKDGAVDVAWFHKTVVELGEDKWKQVYAAAKYATSGVGHKRAQLFADAMLNRKGATERELLAKTKSKRHQDSIRALGLVPLKEGKAGQAQVLARYKAMQEIRRTSRKHGGSMLQASEKRAVEIGMENLARTAGYPDPLRLQWAMERLELGDLIKGPVSKKAGDVKVTLSVADGVATIAAEKKGKALPSVPADLKKKNKDIAELVQRATDLKRSGSRMRQSLEQAMCRGDVFKAEELGGLLQHPMLRTMLDRLVFVSDELKSVAGYLDKGGKVLRDHAGKLEPLKGSDSLRIAHPHDLLKRKDWNKWQKECFAAERVQPFKQVFREVYVLAGDEADKTEAKRYEGHQVNPRQALALLGSRGWITRGEEGVQKTFYKERITARLEFAETFYTPAEVEGLTLRSLSFTEAGKWQGLKLGTIPARVFSESMRDLDLVVSVAHRGGVDPEASQSTVEMRAALVRETAMLLKLKNVALEGTRVAINGERAEYSLHLGSGMVHVLPGGQVWIVPVAAEHRGRLFLPFADGDPKTAEVVSKMLLLARDKEIQDPSILEQIRKFV